MYLFVFLWVPALQEASTSTKQLPLGYIFSCFMVSMMIGSVLYSSVVSSFLSPRPPRSPPVSRAFVPSTSPSVSAASDLLSEASSSVSYSDLQRSGPNARGARSPPSNRDPAVTLHAKLSSLVSATSALALFLAVRTPAPHTVLTAEHARFYAFCLFEVCVGLYYPVQASLRSKLISNEHRATVRLSICMQQTDRADA